MERSGSAGSAVVAIECVAGSSSADEWGGCNGEEAAPLRIGDILEEITFGGSPPARAGRRHEAPSRRIPARRLFCPRAGPPWRALRRAVPRAPRLQFLLLSIRDPNYAIIALVDRSESERIASQANRHEAPSRTVNTGAPTDLSDSANTGLCEVEDYHLVYRVSSTYRL
nr:PREDICTED: uncharacterized protein LOC108952379 [Musa acuminata subsp. malaccensis]